MRHIKLGTVLVHRCPHAAELTYTVRILPRVRAPGDLRRLIRIHRAGSDPPADNRVPPPCPKHTPRWLSTGYLAAKSAGFSRGFDDPDPRRCRRPRRAVAPW